MTDEWELESNAKLGKTGITIFKTTGCKKKFYLEKKILISFTLQVKLQSPHVLYTSFI